MKGILFVNSIKKDYEVIKQITKRDIQLKFRGSKLGLLWSIINPVIMLSIYTFVFSQVFKAKWGGIDTANYDTYVYAMNLFCGLIIFNIFGESMSRAPSLITSNPNFVKKVRFPIHALGHMIAGSTMYQALSSLGILLIFKIIYTRELDLTVLILPILLLLVYLKCLGLIWLISGLSVYIKDISQVISAAISMLMFLSPVFYPIKSLPEKMQWVATLNPIASSIEQARDIILNGRSADFTILLMELIVLLIWCEICFRTLRKLEKGFGDLL